MVKSGSPKPCSGHRLFGSIVSLFALAGMISCGSGTNTFHTTPPPGTNCTMPTPVTTTASTTKGVNQVVPATFMDMHLGSASLPWPTVSFGGLRLWDTGTGWSEINTNSTDFANDTFNWANLDSFVSVAQSHGVDLLYNLARTPTWASSGPTDSNCAYASIGGGDGQCHPPVDLNSDGSGTDQDWINWVTAVALRNKNRYGDQIKYFEIWNEWNIQLFWVGTPKQLVRMEQDARCVVEGPPAGFSCSANSSFPNGTGIDPSAKIVTPSPVGAGYPANNLADVANNFQTYFSTTVGGAAGGKFADVLGFHGYVGTPKGQDLCPIPEDVNTVVDDINGILGQFGETGKPWFNTEGGWSQAQDENFTDQDRQAAFLARYYLLQASLGIDRAYWYRWDSGQTYSGSLWTPSGGATPAATAYGEVYKWIVGATLTSACTPSGNIWSCEFSRSNGYKAIAVWDVSQDCSNGSCTTTAFTVPSGGYTKIRDLAGNETSLSGSSTPVGAKPVLLETGPLP